MVDPGLKSLQYKMVIPGFQYPQNDFDTEINYKMVVAIFFKLQIVVRGFSTVTWKLLFERCSNYTIVFRVI